MMLAAFIVGNLLIIFIQYNSAYNTHNLITGNKKLLIELNAGNQLRELERDILSSEIKIDRAVATADTSRLKEVDLQLSEARGLLDSLRATTDQDSILRHIERLSALTDEKSMMKTRILDSFRRTGRLSFESFRAITQGRPLANDVNNASRRIYEGRQRLLDSLSASNNRSGRNAQTWSAILIYLVLLTGVALFWNIISRIRRQNQLIEQLDSSERKVREISLIKENFMANMSHEIRTPMNAIVGFTNLLKARNRDPELAEFIDAIGQSGKNLLIIINDILDLSKIEAGMMRIESAPFNIRGVLKSVQTMFTEKMREKGLQFSFVVAETVPDVISGDAIRLTQILANMIGNAVKFTAEGSIRVEVTNKALDGDRVWLGFVIRDTGIGIAREKLSDIFERFRQAEDSITRKFGGTGLGLSIVKNLVLLQNGEIAVESEPGKGTVFSFTIPYQIAAAQPAMPVSLVEAGFDYPDFRHVRILVVEDNRMNQNLLGHLLSTWKLSFDIVNNGVESIEKLQAGKYDLVLMDVQMPGMDGYTATREIRTKLKLGIPVIAMTAHAFAGEREKCLDHGMNDYIAKPINEGELFRLIAQFSGIKAERPEAKKDINNEYPIGYQFIDLQYMRRISEGNKEFERRITEQFLEAIPGDIEKLESALADNDPGTIRHIAHSMRSDVAIMGLLDNLQPHLDVLENEAFEETSFRQAMSTVITNCRKALTEARHFFASF